MSDTARCQALREARGQMTAQKLSEELEVSARTVYRDLDGKVKRFAHPQRPALDAVPEALALYQGHRDEGLVVDLVAT